MTSRYSTFSSIPQSILPSSISLVAPTKTASLGPSNIPGNSISSYERTLTQVPATGTASPSSASAAGSESAGSGGVKPAVVGVAVSVSVGIVLLAAGLWIWRTRRATRRQFERRTRGLRMKGLDEGAAGSADGQMERGVHQVP